MWNARNGECVKDLLTDLSGVWQVRFDERRCVAAVQRNNLTYIEVSSTTDELRLCDVADFGFDRFLTLELFEMAFRKLTVVVALWSTVREGRLMMWKLLKSPKWTRGADVP